MSHEVWKEIYDRLVSLIESHRTTLITVNTRAWRSEWRTSSPSASAPNTWPRTTAAQGRKRGSTPRSGCEAES